MSRKPFKLVLEDWGRRRRIVSYQSAETREAALLHYAARGMGYRKAFLVQPSAEDGGKQSREQELSD